MKTLKWAVVAVGFFSVTVVAHLGVSRAGGQLQIGIPGMRPTFVTLADFTDPTYPDGFANYYRGNYGVMGDRSPLVAPTAKKYVVARQ